jgi:uncharacterized membrane protein YbhN (UPF0104 family)
VPASPKPAWSEDSSCSANGAELAVSAVVLFRVATFWLPVAAGAVSMRWLRRNAQLASGS